MSIIGIDIDGVLANYVDAVIEGAVKVGRPMEVTTGALPTTYSMREPGWFTGRDHFFAAHNHVVNNVADVAPLLPRDAIAKLKEAGHTVVAVTARGADNTPSCEQYAKDTNDWLANNYDGFDEIIHTHDKETTGIDLLIEDNGDQVVKCAAQGITTIMVSYPYNEEYAGLASAVASSPAEAIELAAQLA